VPHRAALRWRECIGMRCCAGEEHATYTFHQPVKIFNEFKDLHAYEKLIQKQLPDLIGDRLVPVF
jgi:hypothetical protein